MFDSIGSFFYYVFWGFITLWLFSPLLFGNSEEKQDFMIGFVGATALSKYSENPCKPEELYEEPEECCKNS